MGSGRSETEMLEEKPTKECCDSLRTHVDLFHLTRCGDIYSGGRERGVGGRARGRDV